MCWAADQLTWTLPSQDLLVGWGLWLDRRVLLKDAVSCSRVLLAELLARGALHLPLPLQEKQ